MIAFLNWTDNNKLIHIPTAGANFTWSNKLDAPYFIERRLDICIGNQLWFDSCNQIPVSTLSKLCSDQYALMSDFHINYVRVASQFKILKTQTLHKECRTLRESCWSQKIIGYHMYVLRKKNQLLKRGLRGWNRKIFGNVTENVINANEVLRKIQYQIKQMGINDNLKKQELASQNNLHTALDMEEIFWRDKSIVKWSWKDTRTLCKISNIKSLTSSFEEYVISSRKWVNCNKYFIFGGAMSSSRFNILDELFGFNKVTTPFNYLGVPIFKGKPKNVNLQPITDKVGNKLASWKGYLLSFAGRAELVKSIIQGMLTCIMSVYVWSVSLVRVLEHTAKRFIWSGEKTKNKVVIVA
ncbi:hypothetical protein KIW84_040331 [Lathyrus oleraceus]|uniref:Reverse transcriptase n=1 Tax=Pisum sativum TaxID=3888 RepID=A0A9D4X519_PEA|nr:hypothetical protein KIW84_040331 [Pisum sativum]